MKFTTEKRDDRRNITVDGTFVGRVEKGSGRPGYWDCWQSWVPGKGTGNHSTMKEATARVQSLAPAVLERQRLRAALHGR